MDLEFDYVDIQRHPESRVDVTSLYDKDVHIQYDRDIIDEYEYQLRNAVLTACLEGETPEMMEDVPKYNYALYQNLDRFLDSAVEEMNVDAATPVDDQLMAVLDYVTEHVDYDQYVRYPDESYDCKLGATKRRYELDDYETELSDGAEPCSYCLVDDPVDDLVWDYQRKVLSSVLTEDPEEETTGICINYSCLTSLLGYKIGMECLVVPGVYNESTNHAWNLIRFGGGEKYIDITHFDTTPDLMSEMVLYHQNRKGSLLSERSKRKILNELLMDADSGRGKLYEPNVVVNL